MSATLYIIFLITGLLAGALIAWFIAKSKFNNPLPFSVDEYLTLQNDKVLIEQRYNDLRLEFDSCKSEINKNQERINTLNIEISRLDTINKGFIDKLETQKQEMEDLHKKIKEQFENIASKIIFDNSRMIQQQHSDKLTDILSPLKEKIEKFENTVNLTHKENIRENQSLKEQLKSLQELNKSIG